MRAWLAAVLLAGCSGEEGQEPTIEVPETWKDYRKGTGHVAHLREDVKCKDCHAVEGSGFDRPSLAVCDKCHESVRDRAHRSSKAPQGDCYACHEFKEKSEIAKGACMRCHENQATPAIHAKEDCVACHAPHRDPPLAIGSCAKCHEEQPAFVHVKMNEVEGCRACHEGHEKKEEALGTCKRCHEDKLGAHQMKHASCATCHTPHKKPPTCASCHQSVRRDRHPDCSGCHQTSNTCATCHAEVVVDHGKGDPSCASCHPPHRPVEKCSKCHQISPTDTALHAGNTACAKCHQPHNFVLELIQGEACGQACHTTQEAAAIEGHRDCIDCHRTGAHFPRRPPASCGRCHEGEQRTAPKGHDECAKCHEPHSGKIAEAKRCESCHAQPVNIHTKAGDCRSCHAPHGPEQPVSPADCSTSCHTSLPELHRDRGHAECATCHAPHEPAPRKDRALCDSCHDLPNHEPRVATCVGCHPFR